MFFCSTFQYFAAILHSLSFLVVVVRCGCFIWEDEASRCCEFTDGEDVQCFFSDKPALKLGQQFTGTAAETNSPIFPVKRR